MTNRMQDTRRFVLEGVYGMYNYGCEAIVRGTAAILRRRWPSASLLYWSYRPWADRRALRGADVVVKGRYWRPGISGLPCRAMGRLLRIVGHAVQLSDFATTADCILSIGGDIFTLDPTQRESSRFGAVGHAQRTLSMGRPVILWGASVGPFEGNQYAPEAFGEVLRRFAAITVREPITHKYLARIGIRENVHSVADPAFVMPCAEESDSVILRLRPARGQRTLAVNLSPLSLQYTHEASPIEVVVDRQVHALIKILATSDVDILLVPHVVCPWDPRDDDNAHLRTLFSKMPRHMASRVRLLPAGLGAQRTKRIISCCRALIAARMHCAIAGISCSVPTLLLSYSHKAVGLCDYVYGHRELVMTVSAEADQLAQAARGLLDGAETTRAFLNQRVPEIVADALRAADVVEEVMTAPDKRGSERSTIQARDTV